MKYLKLFENFEEPGMFAGVIPSSPKFEDGSKSINPIVIIFYLL